MKGNHFVMYSYDQIVYFLKLYRSQIPNMKTKTISNASLKRINLSDDAEDVFLVSVILTGGRLMLYVLHLELSQHRLQSCKRTKTFYSHYSISN